MIMDGRIKIKSGPAISWFTPAGIEFDDGTVLEADAIILATGYVKRSPIIHRTMFTILSVGDMRDSVRAVCGDEVYRRCNPIFDLDIEGEIQSIYRDTGVQGLWYATGE